LVVAGVIGLIAVLVALISWARIPPFLAFLLTALLGGLAFGIPFGRLGASVEHGIGDMLGGITAIICLGAMFGRAVADSGATRTVSDALVGAVGPRFILLAMAVTGLIAGIPLFYAVGFVIMVPLILSLAGRTNLPAVYLGIPLLCGLSVAHGFLPPHPSPMALVKVFGADTGLTLFYGLGVAAVTLLVAGPLLASTLKSVGASREGSAPAAAAAAHDAHLRPGVFNSFFTALLPVILIATGTGLAYVPDKPPLLAQTQAVLAQPAIVLVVSLMYATLSLRQGRDLRAMMDGYAASLKDVAGILLVLAGAGALKQVFADSGVNAALGDWLKALPLDPLVLGWLIAMIIRIALGSATIAGLTAAGIMAPVVVARHVDPNLMVLSVGAGSLMCSHINDAGFWLFKEYFGLSLYDTFRSWSLMESIVGLVGLACVLGLNLALHGHVVLK
jgi:Gnt-I system high-affinity gluconate transporter